MVKDKDQPREWGGIARDCGILKPRKANQQPTVFFVQTGHWVLTDFAPDGTPHLGDLKDHRDIANRPDAAPARTVLDPGAPMMPAATTAAAGHGPMVAGVGAGIGTGLVAGIIAADMGTYHDVDPQPPVGWLEAAMAPKAPN